MGDFGVYRLKEIGEKITVSEFFDFIKEIDAKMIDVKFTDLLGTWHHCTYPVSEFDESVFEKGVGFDGSSIPMWQNIDNSDMLALPDPSSACVDPFFELKTVSLIADIVDPITKTKYDKDPRNIAKKAVKYLLDSGIADQVYIGPEPEFFIFDDVKFDSKENLSFYEVNSNEGIWNSGNYEEQNLGYRPDFKGGYFPTPPTDSLANLRSKMCQELIKSGIRIEAHHHEVATAGQSEIDMKYAPLLEMADQMMWYKYVIKNVAVQNNKTVTFMPKPIFKDNGSGMHVHISLWKNGKNLFAGSDYAGLSKIAINGIGGVLKHANSLLAITNPTVNSYHRLVPGYEAPVNLVMSARNRSASVRIPMYDDSAESKRFEFRCPDPMANGYLAFSAILMAVIDGIKNKIEPPEPVDKDIYSMSKEDLAKIPSTPRDFAAALDELEIDHNYLLESGVFTKEAISDYIDYKREKEVDAVALRPHPYEFMLYYKM